MVFGLFPGYWFWCGCWFIIIIANVIVRGNRYLEMTLILDVRLHQFRRLSLQYTILEERKLMHAHYCLLLLLLLLLCVCYFVTLYWIKKIVCV